MLTILFFPFYLIVPRQIIAQFLNLSSNDLATHIFVDDNVEYIFCGYRVTWDEARVICLNYKAELATVDTDRKAQIAIHAIVDNDLPIYDNLWIGGREDSLGAWFWISNGNKLILKSASYRNISLWYPNSSNEDLQQCLSIDRLHHNKSIFVPLRCNQRRSFICQRDRDQSNGKSTKMMGSTRMDEEEFILYSTKLTWPEAVVHCRKEGLQIAEVKTMSQAQSLAFLMIRARPESIENAWIGGYATVNMWKWLSSGSNISNNDLWKGHNRELHGCLLLDRHICEIPVYLEAKCDRKRDVLCQRPSRKWMNKKPIPVYVEECLYWIGLHALTWFQAQLSCKELNASLIILNSSRIINHMMSLMEDNRKELRHIWTDGRRKLSMFNDTPLWRWTWESTSELVSEMDASFVPWCSAGQCYNNDANCLNFDHADYTPIIYGLDCNQSQTYICQPWSAACTPHRSNLNTSYALSGNNDLLQTFSLSKTTAASYYDEGDNQKSLHATIPLFTNHSFPSSTNHNDNLQNNFFFKEERNSIISNSSDYKNNYNARKSYTEKIIYVEENEEKASNNNNITVFLIPSYHIFEKPIKIKLTSKDAENNIHGKFKSNSSFSNINVSSKGNNKIWNKSIFRYLSIPVFNARSYNKIKIYPGKFRSLVYFLPNRYYYP